MKMAAVILTKTFDDNVHSMTCECIHSLIEKANAPSFVLSVVVVESQENCTYTYPAWVKVINPGESFNFHRFLNLGIASEPDADWYLLCNNDLLFMQDWLREIERVLDLQPDLESLSPLSPSCKGQANYLATLPGLPFVIGYERRKHLSGWCFMVRKKTLETIGKLDERFEFYFADDDYALSLRKHNALHALALRSHVFHLEDEKVSQKISSQPIAQHCMPLPRYLLKQQLGWLLENDKMLEGFYIYVGKWGNYYILALKKRLHDVLFLKLGIKIFSKLLFRTHLNS